MFKEYNKLNFSVKNLSLKGLLEYNLLDEESLFCLVSEAQSLSRNWSVPTEPR